MPSVQPKFYQEGESKIYVLDLEQIKAQIRAETLEWSYEFDLGPPGTTCACSCGDIPTRIGKMKILHSEIVHH